MRATIALGLAAMIFLAAAVSPRTSGAASLDGGISGVARDSRGGHLVNAGVRVRNISRGDIVAQLRTGAGGLFSASGLLPGRYVVETLGLSGQVIGVSPMVSVIPGRTSTVTVTAAAQTFAQAQAGGAGGLGTGAIVGIVAGVAAATIVTIAVVTGDDEVASPSQ